MEQRPEREGPWVQRVCKPGISVPPCGACKQHCWVENTRIPGLGALGGRRGQKDALRGAGAAGPKEVVWPSSHDFQATDICTSLKVKWKLWKTVSQCPQGLWSHGLRTAAHRPGSHTRRAEVSCHPGCASMKSQPNNCTLQFIFNQLHNLPFPQKLLASSILFKLYCITRRYRFHFIPSSTSVRELDSSHDSGCKANWTVLQLVSKPPVAGSGVYQRWLDLKCAMLGSRAREPGSSPLSGLAQLWMWATRALPGVCASTSLESACPG